MKVLTWNTWQERGPWQDRWEFALGELAALDADVIALQEVFNRAWADAVQRRLNFAELIYGDDAAGLVFLSRYPVSRSELRTYDTRSPSESYRRYALHAEIQLPDGPAAFFNTHLSWLPHDDAVREAQARELMRWAGEKAGKLPAVAAGDFNSPPVSGAIEEIRRHGFVDVFGSLCAGEPGLTWCNRNPYTLEECNRVSGALLPERRIDYVFFKPGKARGAHPAGIKIVLDRPDARGVWPSDHFGVLATLDLHGA
ncbi:MAG TPA: endonuclease/exonuclease/phosphatase family protein [Verrucomicrobiae bacterium]|jgi:endonuclease/exonuclease/phosphatase family metal-dependent hydrolase|nr:endonuclease/exonuclease/phosphatase family protein [Verrucomicrobiae bacterium]